MKVSCLQVAQVALSVVVANCGGAPSTPSVQSDGNPSTASVRPDGNLDLVNVSSASIGTRGSGKGSFSTAIVRAHGFALQIVLGDAEHVCGSPVDRADFLRGRTLRIDLLQVDRADAPAFVDASDGYNGDTLSSDFNSWYALSTRTNTFGAYLVPEHAPTDWHPAFEPATSGTLTLSSRPNYDTGEVSGTYSVVVGDETLAGTFNAAYCPTGAGVDVAGLSSRFGGVNECGISVFLDTPVEPDPLTGGLDNDDLARERAIRALGLHDVQDVCLDAYFLSCYTCFRPGPDVPGLEDTVTMDSCCTSLFQYCVDPYYACDA